MLLLRSGARQRERGLTWSDLALSRSGYRTSFTATIRHAATPSALENFKCGQ